MIDLPHAFRSSLSLSLSELFNKEVKEKKNPEAVSIASRS
jgi:hypothetical protein